MSTVRTNNVSWEATQAEQIPTSELKQRIVKSYWNRYTGGQWNPNNSYNWIPGMHVDYAPARTDTRLRVTCCVPQGRNSGSSHTISHWIFYTNTNTEVSRHSVSGQHRDTMREYTWDVASWGTNTRRIGYRMRSYADNNNELRLYVANHWNGGGGDPNCYGTFSIMEYLPV